MKAEILCVGTELLLGDILNTNAQYIAKELSGLGISVYNQSVVGDNGERLKKSLNLALSRADLVITTGGLGPTKDDLTKEFIAEYFNKELILDEKSLEWIKSYFKKKKQDMVESNKKQAYFPEGSIILENKKGTAPGCIVSKDKKIVILLPGPPSENKPMFEQSVIPYLRKYSENVFISKVLRVIGKGESSAAEKISDLLDMENPTVAPYAKENEVTFRITANGKNEKEAEELIKPVEKEIRNRLKEDVYATGDKTIEDVVGELLINKKMSISCAESCTGGLLSATLINYPGISSVFKEGIVTYSNEAKMSNLNVSKDTLEKYGAVSNETAKEMAEGIAKKACTNIGLSTTGLAGPGGGTEEKPVGLVYIGMYINGKIQTRRLNLTGSRQKIRNRAVILLLDWLRRELIK